MSNASAARSVADAHNEPTLSDREGDFVQSMDARDYYMPSGNCPPWCDSKHRPSCREDDRRHSGPAFFLPLRHLDGEYFEGNIIGTDLVVSLEQPALHRDPRVRLEVTGKNGHTVMLTVREAGLLTEALQSLVTEANQ